MSKLMLIKIDKAENEESFRLKKNKDYHRIKNYGNIVKLSKPKIKSNSDDDFVGPGSYEPKDNYLSTKSKSPSAVMTKSSRFIDKLPPLKKNEVQTGSKLNLMKDIQFNLVNSPSYTFKRTGHNLKLVDNPEFPGAGRYSPSDDSFHKGYSFYKSRRDFSWKKGKLYIVKLQKELLSIFTN